MMDKFVSKANIDLYIPVIMTLLKRSHTNTFKKSIKMLTRVCYPIDNQVLWILVCIDNIVKEIVESSMM